MLELQSLKPGWRIRTHYDDAHPDSAYWVGTVIQFDGEDGALYFAPDDRDWVALLFQRDVDAGNVTVEVIDRSGELDVEEVDGPWRGLTTTDGLGRMVRELTHEDPVQSGPVNSVMSHPKDGYDTPDEEPCIHPFVQDDCVSCWRGLVHRQNEHIVRLRQMLRDAGAAPALAVHDAYWFGEDWEEQG